MDNDAGGFAYYDARENLATDLRNGAVACVPEKLVEHVMTCASVPRPTAALWVERFVLDLRRRTAASGDVRRGAPG